MAKTKETYLLGYVIGQIEAYCYMITTGCKPCALVNIPYGCEDTINKYLAENYSNISYIAKDEQDPWPNKAIYLFKDKYLKQIIENIPDKCGLERDWYMGKLFGYSDEEICKFISKNTKYKEAEHG